MLKVIVRYTSCLFQPSYTSCGIEYTIQKVSGNRVFDKCPKHHYYHTADKIKNSISYILETIMSELLAWSESSAIYTCTNVLSKSFIHRIERPPENRHLPFQGAYSSSTCKETDKSLGDREVLHRDQSLADFPVSQAPEKTRTGLDLKLARSSRVW